MTEPDTLPTTVLRNTYTFTDLQRRVDLLQRFLEHLFFESGSEDGDRAALLKNYYREADENLRHHVDATAAWGPAVLDSFTASNLYERLPALKQAAKTLPTLTLYVPVRFSSAQMEPIGIWCRAYVHSDLMLDMKVDATAIGGCEIAYNNVFHDFSFSYFVAKKQTELMKLIHDYDA